MAAHVDPAAVRITNQFRSRTGFVYDLKAGGVRLTLEIAKRQAEIDPGEWSVAAHASLAPDTKVEAWGPTRTETLREVARRWAASAAERGLPSFDWEAVAKALAEVRAV